MPHSLESIEKKIAGYFSGAKTKRLYDEEICYEMSKPGHQPRRKLIEALESSKRVAQWGTSYISNIGDLLSTAALLGYAATEDVRFLSGSLTGFVCFEFFRYGARKRVDSAKSSFEAWRKIDEKTNGLEGTLASVQDQVGDTLLKLLPPNDQTIN